MHMLKGTGEPRRLSAPEAAACLRGLEGRLWGMGSRHSPPGGKVRNMISVDRRWKAQQRERSAVTGYHRQPNRRLCRAATRQNIVERHENLSCF